MALKTHNLPLDVLKNDFEVEKAMFHGFDRPWEFIFCILRIEKATDEFV
jgi:hypothetical protein